MFNSAATATQLYLEIHLCQCPIWYIFHCCNKKLLLYIGNTPYSCAIKYPFCVFVHIHVTPYPAVALARPPKWGKIIPFSVDILKKLVKSCINYWKITLLYWCIVTLFLYMCIFMGVFVVVCVFCTRDAQTFIFNPWNVLIYMLFLECVSYSKNWMRFTPTHTFKSLNIMPPHNVFSFLNV